jgi:hypothetical protein
MRWPPVTAESRSNASGRIICCQIHMLRLLHDLWVGSDTLTMMRAGVRWIQNAQGQPVIDRAYNMVQLLNMYMGRSPISDEDVSLADWQELKISKACWIARPVARHVLEEDIAQA